MAGYKKIGPSQKPKKPRARQPWSPPAPFLDDGVSRRHQERPAAHSRRVPDELDDF